MTVSKLASLQRSLAGRRLDSRVRLLAISYEPQFDSPDRIHSFCASRGMSFGSNAQALRLEPASLQRLIDEIEAPVNYNAGWVNTHGVQLTLIDRGGRIVRQYHTLIWNNRTVEEDLQRLLVAHH